MRLHVSTVVRLTDVLGKYVADVEELQAGAGVCRREEIYRLKAPGDGVEQGSR